MAPHRLVDKNVGNPTMRFEVIHRVEGKIAVSRGTPLNSASHSNAYIDAERAIAAASGNPLWNGHL
jgi:hypothetical protein